jgi:DNA-binding transcriptional MerR regulator
VTVPELNDIDEVTRDLIERTARRHGLDPDLLQAACEAAYAAPVEETDDIEEMARALKVFAARQGQMVRQQTIRDLRDGKIPLAEIAAAQGITGPQNLDDLHSGIDLSDEEAEGLERALTEGREDPRAEIERLVRTKVAEQLTAYRCDYNLCGMCTCRADLVKLLRGES